MIKFVCVVESAHNNRAIYIYIYMRKYSHMYMALQKQEQGKVQVKFAEYWTLVYVGVNCGKQPVVSLDLRSILIYDRGEPAVSYRWTG